MHIINNSKIKPLYFSFLLFILSSTFFTASCRHEQKTVDSTLEQCRKILDKDDFAGATECYEKATEDFPDQAVEIARTGNDGVLNKCFELFDKEKYEQSLICIDPAAVLKAENVSFASDDPQLYILLADNFFRHRFFVRSYEENIKLMERGEKAVNLGLKLDAENAAAHWIYGEILYEKGDSQRAEAEFRKAIKLSPESNEYWIKLADKQSSSNLYWEAVSSYNQALLIDPENAFVLYQLGVLYEKLDRTDSAILAYEKLLKIPSELIEERFQDELDEARQSLEQLKLRRRGDEKQNKQTSKDTFVMGN